MSVTNYGLCIVGPEGNSTVYTVAELRTMARANARERKMSLQGYWVHISAEGRTVLTVMARGRDGWSDCQNIAL